MTNNFELVHKVINDFKSHEINVLLGGGWAEEFLGIIPRRTHKDIDLFFIGEDFKQIETHLIEVGKSSRLDGHKLSFREQNVSIEITLIQRDEKGHFTIFYHQGDQRAVRWPEPISEINKKIECLSPKCLCFRRAMDKYIKGKANLIE